MTTDDRAPETTPVAPQAQPKPEPKKDPVALAYKGDGERHYASRGVPARDLSVRELLDLEPATFNHVTAPEPSTGTPLYELTSAGKKAWEERYGG